VSRTSIIVGIPCRSIECLALFIFDRSITLSLSFFCRSIALSLSINHSLLYLSTELFIYLSLSINGTFFLSISIVPFLRSINHSLFIFLLSIDQCSIYLFFIYRRKVRSRSFYLSTERPFFLYRSFLLSVAIDGISLSLSQLITFPHSTDRAFSLFRSIECVCCLYCSYRSLGSVFVDQ
jgi:hypothetical protein